MLPQIQNQRRTDGRSPSGLNSFRRSQSHLPSLHRPNTQDDEEKNKSRADFPGVHHSVSIIVLSVEIEKKFRARQERVIVNKGGGSSETLGDAVEHFDKPSNLVLGAVASI